MGLCDHHHSQNKEDLHHLKIPHWKNLGTSLGAQRLRLQLPMPEVQVWFLVGELRSHKSHGQKNQNIKQKQECNKFNKGFKNGSH